ncbi:glucose n-acetyltransferase [Colletotrichum truncatum]|uniref:Glucose n-acetyltransferase n=1 Tax=Colletotrichum truncatum TaxID=5467 RepID=A0ACC3ZK44_COLTU|nr:glucose n-acetyltransferase [Colletotrichum truncatum]KAF6799873.1 glucose n-acetyltransferase [Colletotrichum truncatum]
MQLQSLPRRVQTVAGLSLVVCMFLLTFILLRRPDYKLTSFKDNTERPKWVPTWPAEQAEPRFAYAQYVTNIHYLCNAVINFGLLRRFGAKHDLVLIHPKNWLEGISPESKALARIRSERPEIQMRAFDVLSTNKGDATWHDSPTKFQAFALTEWKRVFAFDSDSLVLNNMDHYFLSPATPIAVSRAYWLTEKNTDTPKQVLGSHVMLIEPNEVFHQKIIKEAKASGNFDMEIINHLFQNSAMVLPHRGLALLTGEFRAKDHSKYLAPDEDEEWDAVAELSRSYLVHFSDWPLPKPWVARTKQQWEASLPDCPNTTKKGKQLKCADRVVWTSIYEDYDREKNDQCKIVFE